MNKQYFENEEEAREYNDIMEKCCEETKGCNYNNCSECRVIFTKENGFIKQTELEKAKILNDKIMEKSMGDYDIGDINTIVDYNIELKKEIERLKQ